MQQRNATEKEPRPGPPSPGPPPGPRHPVPPEHTPRRDEQEHPVPPGPPPSHVQGWSEAEDKPPSKPTP
jgi:hypothetical protein